MKHWITMPALCSVQFLQKAQVIYLRLEQIIGYPAGKRAPLVILMLRFLDSHGYCCKHQEVKMQMNTITHHGKIKKEAKLTFLSQDHHTTITCFPHNVRVQLCLLCSYYTAFESVVQLFYISSFSPSSMTKLYISPLKLNRHYFHVSCHHTANLCYLFSNKRSYHHLRGRLHNNVFN